MKKFIFFVTGYLALSLIVHAQTWTPLTSGTTANLNAVQFLDANNGFVCGGAGVVRKTTDGGTTWSPVNISTTNPVQAISFINTLEGWAVVGDDAAWQTSGSVWKTTNGGTSWTQQTFTGSVYMGLSVNFINSTTGWVGFAHDMANSGKNIYSTTSGGTSWTANPTSIDWLWTYDMDFLTSSTGWVVSNDQTNGYILGTANGGTSWTKTSIVLPFLYGVDFLNSTNGFAVGDSGKILATTNGGTSWATQTSGTTVTLNEVSFTSVTSGWIVGATGKILITANGGTNWAGETSGTTQNLNDISALNTTTAWAVGDGGVILKRSGPAGFNEIANEKPVSVFPNPFNAETTIDLTDFTGAGEVVNMKIYDSTGREIENLTGIAQLSFKLNLSGFAKGIYQFCIITKNGMAGRGRLMLTE